jgi:uncharacterized protein
MYGEARGMSRKRGAAAADRATAGEWRSHGAIVWSMRHLDAPLVAKKRSALERLRASERVVVALSGGVDSAVLLALAVEALGPERVIAVTGRSPAVPESEIEDARRVAAGLGTRHEVVRTRELDRPGYRENAGDRCYHCRSELFGVLEEFAKGRGFRSIAYGAIVDDLGDDRPGMRAAVERGALAPLLEAGIDKHEVRRLAAEAGLEVRDKPAAACLASRIPVGTEVTPERLRAVQAAEAALRAEGLRQVRVRHHGEIARIETDEAGMARLQAPGARARAVAAIRAAGFRFVVVDLEGYRVGGGVAARPPLYRIAPARDGGQ